MKLIVRLMLAVALAALPQAAAADDGSQTQNAPPAWGANASVATPSLPLEEGETQAWIGAWSDDVSGSPDRVLEFAPDDYGLMLGLFVSSHGDNGSVMIRGETLHSDEGSAEVDFDVARVFRSHTTWDKLLHRFGHDPMSYLESTSTNGKVVSHTDLNPGMEYDLTYQVIESWNEFQFPGFSALTLGVGFRDQKREGHKQAFTTNHCDACHVVSRNHPINERTKDGTLAADIAWAGGAVRASATSRELTHQYPSLTHLYDDALHPELRTPVFDNRLQYDSAEGPQTVDLWPDIDKDIYRLDLDLHDVGGFVLNGRAVWSETQNGYTGYKADYSGYVVNAARAWDSGWRLRWRGRIYQLSNDDVFIDTNERTTQVGAHAGKTYEDVYGVNYDHTRYSVLDRDVMESRADLSYRLKGKAGTVSFKWDYTMIDRDTYQVAVGETETSTNLVGVSWRARPAKGWQLQANLRHAEVDNPFMLVDGACSTLVSTSYPNPFNPSTPQYDDQHQTRVADTTASASTWDELKLGASYAFGSASVAGTYRWWEGDNSDGDLTDWSRTNQTATVTVWSAPAQNWDWYLGYAWHQGDIDSPVCIPIFDG